MSILEHLPALQTAVNELRKIQKTRKKVNMDEGIFIGLATVIRAFKTEEQCEEQNQARLIIMKVLGQLHLACGYISVPLDLIDYGQCSNNIVTVYLKEDDHLPFKKIVFEMPSIGEVDNFIDKVKLPQKPRLNTYEHDGDVTSSSADSDSGRSGTGGVDNSFDSDDPSATEDL